jgi:hypothetical protein
LRAQKIVCGMKSLACALGGLAAAAFVALGILSEAHRVPDQP